MKKLLKIFILLFLYQSLFYANDLESSYYCNFKNTNNYWRLLDFRFNNNNYDLTIPDADEADVFNIPHDKLLPDDYYVEKGTYEIKEEKGLETIYFTSNSDFTVMEKIGILNYGKLLYLISGQNIFIDSFFVFRDPPTSPYMEEYTINSSSFLTEGDVKYDGSSFYYSNNSLVPWVEGIKGDGKGQWVELDFSATP